MKPYSMDLRKKVLAAVDRGEPYVLVAKRFEIAERTVRAYRVRRDQGRLEPKKSGPRPTGNERSRTRRDEQPNSG